MRAARTRMSSAGIRGLVAPGLFPWIRIANQCAFPCLWNSKIPIRRTLLSAVPSARVPRYDGILVVAYLHYYCQRPQSVRRE